MKMMKKTTRSCFLCSILMTVHILIAASIHGARAQPLRELRYALFTSGPKGDDFDFSGAIPAMELAEEEILKDPSILQGYKLTHTPTRDTQVHNNIINIIE